uniref:Breast cancer anti-estrogen resistance protein 3 homolog n=3 Tax=Cacopsylla melanoneura TaxID=428564 RepID=A0A8D9A9M9_9HEMI
MGKNASKLKKRKRSQSIVWSFRFPSSAVNSLTRKGKSSTSGTTASSPHLDITQWLLILELDQYASLFQDYGGVEEFLHLTETDVKEMGVKSSAHRARIIASLKALAAKYEKENRKAEKKLNRHSVAVDTNRLQNQTECDLLVVSNAIQSKSLSNIRMEPTPDPFADPLQLKKALEWELSLDNRDLRSHAWYHGAIPRARAEEIIEAEGQFLIRDCTSQPGNYVLSCMSKNQYLHFVINKVVIQPDTVYERVQFQFEDDLFDTVPDLITFYVGSGKHISSLSGAKIKSPKNRLYPLSFYASKYAHLYPLSTSNLSSPLSSHMSRSTSECMRYNSSISSYRNSPVSSPPMARHSVKHRSQSLTASEFNRSLTISPPVSVVSSYHISNSSNSGTGDRMSNSADGVITESQSLSRIVSSNTLSRSNAPSPSPFGNSTLPRTQSMRHTRDVATLDAPPKPSRGMKYSDSTTTLHHMNQVSYQASGSDSGNGSGDSVQSSATGDGSESTTPVSTLPHQRPSGVVIKNPRYGLPTSCSSSTLKAFTYDSLVEDDLLSSYPDVQLPSCFDLDNFQTLLLPSLENKPLDATALQGIHMMLLETGSRILANHLTRIDLLYTTSRDLPKYDPYEHLIGKLSGIELCTLPIGRQLRYDLIERAQCMKLIVAITILTCGSDSERAEILNKWIQVAVDTKTALGNLFGFSNIMLGLMMPQIQRLSVTWHVLRQKFTDSAFSFEAKLRPTLKSMNECTNPNAPNTTIPYVLPLILLQEKSFDDLCAQNCLECLNLFSSCITCWETSSSDFGLTILFNHLESARKLTEGLHTFQRNCQIVLSDSKVDDLLLDMFRTEFHLKFLWGSKGSGAHLMQRYKKFEQILNVMSAKCQPDEDSNNKTSSSNGCEVSNKQSAISSNNCDVGNMGHSQSHYTALGTNV